ncbi:MAG: hypothetical protein LBI61_03140 [Puniceicoccales bacterium]|jgi:hypothetical protein|nr:hypothetical protein [Puniceicoccales bacterium]
MENDILNGGKFFSEAKALCEKEGTNNSATFDISNKSCTLSVSKIGGFATAKLEDRNCTAFKETLDAGKDAWQPILESHRPDNKGNPKEGASDLVESEANSKHSEISEEGAGNINAQEGIDTCSTLKEGASVSLVRKPSDGSFQLIDPNSEVHKHRMEKPIAPFARGNNSALWIGKNVCRRHLNAELFKRKNQFLLGDKFFAKGTLDQKWRTNGSEVEKTENASEKKELHDKMENLWPGTNFAEYVFGQYSETESDIRYNTISEKGRRLLGNIISETENLENELKKLNDKKEALSYEEDARKKQLEDGITSLKVIAGSHGNTCSETLTILLLQMADTIDTTNNVTLAPDGIANKILTQYRTKLSKEVIDPLTGTLLNRNLSAFIAGEVEFKFGSAPYMKRFREEYALGLKSFMGKFLGLDNSHGVIGDVSSGSILLKEPLGDVAENVRLLPEKEGGNSITSEAENVFDTLSEEAFDETMSEFLMAPVTFEEFCAIRRSSVKDLRASFAEAITKSSDSNDPGDKAALVLLRYWTDGFAADMSSLGGIDKLEKELQTSIKEKELEIDKSQKKIDSNISVEGVNARDAAKKNLQLLKYAVDALENLKNHTNATSQELQKEGTAVPLGLIREILIGLDNFDLIPEFAKTSKEQRKVMAELYFPAYLYSTGALILKNNVQIPEENPALPNPFPKSSDKKLKKREKNKEIEAWYTPENFTLTPQNEEDLYFERQINSIKTCGIHALNHYVGYSAFGAEDMRINHVLYQIATSQDQFKNWEDDLKELLNDLKGKKIDLITAENWISKDEQISTLTENIDGLIEDSDEIHQAVSEIAEQSGQILNGEKTNNLPEKAKIICNYLDKISKLTIPSDDRSDLEKQIEGIKLKILQKIEIFDPRKGAHAREVQKAIEDRFEVKLHSESGKGEDLSAGKKDGPSDNSDFSKAISENKLPNGVDRMIVDIGDHFTCLRKLPDGQWILLNSLEAEPTKVSNIKDYLSGMERYEVLYCESSDDQQKINAATNATIAEPA